MRRCISFMSTMCRAVAAIGDDNYLLEPVVEEEIREARERLNKVLPTVASVTYAHLCVTGSPVTEILAVAEDKRVDLIVMASHGRTGLSRLLMGSVAEGVMREAPCPVLVVRQPTAKGEQVKNLFTPSQQTRLLT